MSTKQSCVFMILALVAGWIGGTLSNQFPQGHPAAAAEMAAEPAGLSDGPAEIIRARGLLLVDDKNRVRGRFEIDRNNHVNLMFVHENGSVPIAMVAAPTGNAKMRLLGKGGAQITWPSPNLAYQD